MPEECKLTHSKVIIKLVHELEQLKTEINALKSKIESEKNDLNKPTYTKSCNTSYCGC